MNVLSIDFDIIMAPDIDLYNNMVDGGEGTERKLENLVNNFPMLQYCRADLDHYTKIFNYLMKNLKHLQVSDIRVSFNHEDIKNVLNDCEDAHVFNIDHHHDLGYPDPENKEGDVCTCANWGDYFFKNQTIVHFTWLKNTNSVLPITYEEEDERVEYINLNEYDLNELPKIDKLFICLSPEWVSTSYYPLFYLLLDLINNQKNCHLEIH